MVTPPFSPIEVTEPTVYRTGKRVAFGEIAKRFKKRWYVDLSVGRVFFQRLGQMDRDATNVDYANEHPEFVDIVRDTETLREFVSKGVPLDAAHMAKLEELNRALEPIERLQASRCIVDIAPDGTETRPFDCLEDYDAFLTALEPGEVDAVYRILREMITTAPLSEESHVMLALAKEYNIPIAEGLTVENMTAEIADALAENAEVVADATKREISSLKG